MTLSNENNELVEAISQRVAEIIQPSEPPSEPPKLRNERKAAPLLGISFWTLKSYRQRGLFPAPFRDERPILYSEQDIENVREFLRTQK